MGWPVEEAIRRLPVRAEGHRVEQCSATTHVDAGQPPLPRTLSTAIGQEVGPSVDAADERPRISREVTDRNPAVYGAGQAQISDRDAPPRDRLLAHRLRQQRIRRRLPSLPRRLETISRNPPSDG